MEASALSPPAAIVSRRPGGGVLLRLRTDEQLVALFRQGNEDAFRLIHDRYRQRLSAYARQMLGGSATDADDAMQDVFLRAYAALRADDRPVTLRAWLYRVAHNRCIDHLRRPASQPTAELSEEHRPLAATTGDPLQAAERREDLRRLVSDVRALPEQQRSALLMREMEGLTYQELAAALSVTVPAVKSLLVRARMGLVESRQARDTPCQEIREDITTAYDRGVRASGRARRHVRECPGCAGYRTTLKGVGEQLGALTPAAGPWGFLAKLIGLGAGGSGAAAAGGGATGTVATVAGATAATKIAAVVCCAAVLGGGVEAAREHADLPRRQADGTHHSAGTIPARPAQTAAASTRAAALPAVRSVAPAERRAARERAARRPAPGRVVAGSRDDAAVALTAPDPFTAAVVAPPAGDLAPETTTAPGPRDGGLQAPAEDADLAPGEATGTATGPDGSVGSGSSTAGPPAPADAAPSDGGEGSTAATQGPSGGTTAQAAQAGG